MYRKKFIAFIDILGFGSLVEQSAEVPDITKSIHDALVSMNPSLLKETMYGSLNEEKIPKEELAEAKEVAAFLAAKLSQLSPVTISYFSDSLVLSAEADDIVGSQTILELLAKLSIKLWDEHSLLIRGGITLGDLVHDDNGPLFGPAMNQAYFLESKEAVSPRIIFDKHCIEAFRKIRTFEIFDALINEDEKYCYMSLPSSFRFITTSSTLAFSRSLQLEIIEKAQAGTAEKIQAIINSNPPSRVKDKYLWLKDEMGDT